MGIEQRVFDAINPTVVELGFEIVAVEYTKKGEDMHLSVFCDNVNDLYGLSLDDCEKINNAIDSVLDSLNPTNDRPYILNVSSPGLDRPFVTDRDYERNINREIEAVLSKPIGKMYSIKGTLVSFGRDDDVPRIAVRTARGEKVVSLLDVKQTTLLVRF